MRVLFLDDMEERHVRFENHFDGQFDITHAWGYKDCVDYLKSEEFDLVFLDHDLAETEIPDDPEDIFKNEFLSGTDVVHTIVQTMEKNEKSPGFVVHSVNPEGRERMVKMLRHAGFDAQPYPFYWLF